MQSSFPPTIDTYRSPQLGGPQFAALLGVLAVIFIAGFALGGEAWQIALAGLQTLPFMLLALLAYLGLNRTWAKIAALLWLGGLMAGAWLVTMGMSFGALQESAPSATNELPRLVDGGGLKLALITLLIPAAQLIAAIGFLPPARRLISRYLPIDATSFVHMLALVTIVACTLISFVPLAVLGAPPLLAVVEQAVASGKDLTEGRGHAGLLLDTLYALVWLVPGTILAVGYGVRRDLRDALTRLGLVRPTWRQVLAGIGLAAALVVAVQFLGMGIDWLWDTLGWPKTNERAFGEMLAFAMSPIGAVVIGITAGLGEELAVRGVLQPRFGILLPNMFFASLHAFQYNWDAVLVVFLIGLALGLIRKRTNTTTSAIVHGGYDFLLIMAAVLQAPWLGQ